MTILTVLQSGYATVQDLGRAGRASVGICVNGAADSHAATTANTLVGNRLGSALIETTGSAFSFVASADIVIAVTGAAEKVVVDGFDQPAWETLVVPAGRHVLVEAPHRGWRCYVAINGLIEADVVLGSVAPDSLLGVGTRLLGGQELSIRSRFEGLDHPHTGVPVFRIGPSPARCAATIHVDVTPGPERDQFGHDVLDPPYEVSVSSDHVGLRASGPTPARSDAGEILSRGVPVGAVEVPPSGGLLVLLRGRLLTAGYPVPAVATATSLDRLGQARPGSTLMFRWTDTRTAVGAARDRRRATDELGRRVASAFRSSGIGHVLD
ncbi:MAG: hypothetical protein ABWX74_20965 [Aeromicrobium sp.]